jgi:hypothetical protein
MALELDGRRHAYTAEAWLPVVYDIAQGELTDTRLDREPPSVVEHAQQAGRWTAIAIDNLDQDAALVSDAIADAPWSSGRSAYSPTSRAVVWSPPADKAPESRHGEVLIEPVQA